MRYAIAPKRRAPRGRSMAGDLYAANLAIADAHAGLEWPAVRWQSDPAGFAETILGVQLWSRQIDILEGIRDNSRVAVAGGRKIGKDFVLAVAALWFYASFPDARVFMSAVTGRQIREVLYLEIRKRFARSGRCLRCVLADPNGTPPCPHSALLTGKLGERPDTGLTSPDFREIKGNTANTTEGLAGTSGARLMCIIDEASGYPEHLHVALRGNLAAEGCKEVLISNPTRPRGFFADAFRKVPSPYKTFQVSSLESPNVVEGREVFPGLASRSWVKGQAADWGEDSPLFKVHVLGQFVLNEEGAVFSVHAITTAEQAWHDAKAEGPHSVGVDPAGDSNSGDECAFASRKGKKVVSVHARRGLTPEQHLIEVLGLIARDGNPGERSRVVIDREGETGAKVWGAFVAHVHSHPDAFDLVGVRSSERAHRKPETYDRVRDELCASAADFVRDGGTFPADTMMQKELQAFQWYAHISGRTKARSKDDIKAEIGRSPDRADAFMLSCWETQAVGATSEDAATTSTIDPYDSPAEETFDPYSALDVWRN